VERKDALDAAEAGLRTVIVAIPPCLRAMTTFRTPASLAAFLDTHAHGWCRPDQMTECRVAGLRFQQIDDRIHFRFTLLRRRFQFVEISNVIC
jgi:hypothetical protein